MVKAPSRGPIAMGITTLEVEVANLAHPDVTERLRCRRRHFREKGDATLLGALTLEALGLLLDPIKRALRPMQLIL
jgi:hypothetical protein